MADFKLFGNSNPIATAEVGKMTQGIGFDLREVDDVSVTMGMPVAPNDQPYVAQGSNWFPFQPLVIQNLPVYGTQYQYAEDLSESSTSSGSFQEKLKLTTPALPAGNYMVGWSAEVRNNSDERGVRWQIQLNDTITLGEGRFNNDEESNTSYISVSGFAQVTLLVGVHIIDIDWARASGGSARIRNARIQLYRVA